MEDRRLGVGRQNALGRCRTTEQGPNPHDEFEHLEGLLQIIVGAEAKALDQIVQRRARGKEQDGRGGVDAAHTTDHLEAVHSGHHNVSHHKVRSATRKTIQAMQPVGGVCDLKSFALQRVLNDQCQRGFVFHQ